MRSIIVWEKSDAQVMWSFGEEDKIVARINIGEDSHVRAFQVNELIRHLEQLEGDLVVPLDYNNVFMLDEDDIHQLLVEHREDYANMEYLEETIDEACERIKSAAGDIIEDLIEKYSEYSMDTLMHIQDDIMRRVKRIVEDLEEGTW